MNSFSKIFGVSYGRVSTTEQAFHKDGSRIEDASPVMQKVRCEQFVDSLNNKPSRKTNFVLKEHLSDDGFSGKNINRPNFKKLISMIKSEEVKFVVATELSRISRSTQDFLEFVSLCEKYKVDIFIIGFDLDTSTPIGRAILTILVSLAQFERETTSERVRNNAKARLVTDGKINGACEVLGLDSDPTRKGHFIINKVEVKVLEEILNMFLLTSSKIETLREIKRKNIKWKRDQEFTKHRLYALFNSVQDRYRGIWSIDKKGGEKDKFINLPHGPLVDLNLLDKVQNKLDEVAVKKRKPGKNYLYLLTSLLVHEDGSKFTGQPAKERQYRYYYNPQNKLRINCEEIDELVIKRLAEYISNQDYLVKLISSAMSKKTERLPQVKEQLKITQESLSKIEQDENDLRCKFEFTQGRDNSVINSWLEEQILSLRAKKEACNKELERLGSIQNELLRPIPIANLQKHIRDFLGKKDDMRFHRRTLLELIFNKIVIKGSDVIELHLFDDIFRENFIGEVGLGKNKATSLHCGLNGGSNRT